MQIESHYEEEEKIVRNKNEHLDNASLQPNTQECKFGRSSMAAFWFKRFGLFEIPETNKWLYKYCSHLGIDFDYKRNKFSIWCQTHVHDARVERPDSNATRSSIKGE